MDFDKIISDLKNKVYHPVYFLMGEEPFFIDEVSNYIEKTILDDSEKEFNQTVLYGGETNILQVISEAKSYPMMSNYRVVIVKEAQNMKSLTPPKESAGLPRESFRTSPSPKGEGSENKKHPLELYLENPQKSTILVFCHKYKTVDMRTSIGKIIEKKAVVLKSKSLYDSQIPKWVENFVSSKGYSIEPHAIALLTEFLGNDLGKIANELEKLFINLTPPKESAGTSPTKYGVRLSADRESFRTNPSPEGEGRRGEVKITTDHIQKYIGISKEYNNFELQAAIGQKNVLKANRIINYFASNPKDNPMVVTVASLAGYFSKVLMYHSLADKSQNNVASALKVPPFFVKDYVSASAHYPFNKVMNVISVLREYDMKSKGYESTGTAEGELLKEMVFRIIH